MRENAHQSSLIGELQFLIRDLQESLNSVIREFSAQLWSVNQWTMEAEEVSDS
jgi:hypothetical protein